MSLPIAIGITGASGAPYWRRLIGVLLADGHDVHLTHSSNADAVCRAELSLPLADVLTSLEAKARDGAKLRVFASNDFYAPMASGSARYRGMVIVPCSMGTLGRIASGASADLLTRAADVMLKERRRLVLLCRETPLNLVHLRNMTRLGEAGAVIMPASPGFYQKPKDIDDLIDFMIQRVCDQLDLEVQLMARWGEPKS